MRVLFLGDIVGRPGRELVEEWVPLLRAELALELVIANAENVAGGRGIMPPQCQSLLRCGIDVLTTGNHAWAREGGWPLYDSEPRLLRPANYPPGTPGRGFGIFRTRSGSLIGVANLMGRARMDTLVSDPFAAFDEIAAHVAAHTRALIVDFHAESTAEKGALAWWADGRASLVVGTHTHVPTADERILPQGTAFLTDAGMCGPEDSVLGVEPAGAIARMRSPLFQPLRVVEEGASRLHGVLVELDPTTGRALAIERITR